MDFRETQRTEVAKVPNRVRLFGLQFLPEDNTAPAPACAQGTMAQAVTQNAPQIHDRCLMGVQSGQARAVLLDVQGNEVGFQTQHGHLWTHEVALSMW